MREWFLPRITFYSGGERGRIVRIEVTFEYFIGTCAKLIQFVLCFQIFYHDRMAGKHQFGVSQIEF